MNFNFLNQCRNHTDSQEGGPAPGGVAGSSAAQGNDQEGESAVVAAGLAVPAFADVDGCCILDVLRELLFSHMGWKRMLSLSSRALSVASATPQQGWRQILVFSW